MGDYTFSVGTHDPSGFSADTDEEAIRIAATHAAHDYADELRTNPQEVVTLMGRTGLLTRPSERLDEFLARLGSADPALNPDTLQPGDTNAPDCNGD